MTWLEQARPLDGWTGYRMDGLWDDSLWVLNPIYVRDDLPLLLEPDEVQILRRYASLDRRESDVAAYEAAFGPEWTLEDVPDPRTEPGWRRVSWTEFGRLVGVDPFAERRPPSWACFPSWTTRPRASSGPDAGTLDRDALERVVHHLAVFSDHGGGELCWCYYAPPTTDHWDEPTLIQVPLRDIPSRPHNSSLGVWNSPTNIWPDGRAWFVYTDYDLCSTQVSGSSALVADLANDPGLETVRLEVRWFLP